MIDRKKLFGRAPKISDIFQGTIEDYYFLLDLGSIINRYPEYVQSILIDNGDGEVTGRFFIIIMFVIVESERLFL